MATTPAKFLGNTVGEAAAFAAGVAIAPLLHPIVQSLTNEAWELDPTKPIDATLIAEAVAHGHIDPADGQAEAGLTGTSPKRFAALVKAAKTGPGVTSAFELWRRGRITPDQFDEALTRAGIEPDWIAFLHELKDRRLDPPVIALAIVRGIMDDPGFLPVGPPATEGKVKAFPVSPLDSLKEAAASGFDRDRLFVQTAISGRPMGPESAASAVFRDILDRVDFDRAVSEGDVRNEWASAIFETARQIASASDYVTAHLKGWITETEMYAGTARHGMSREDTHLMYLRSGRPAAPGQMATAAARGIDGPDGRPMDRAQFLKGIAQSDIRPEWGPMLWDSRYLYPPLFQLTRLVTAGTITPALAADWATKDRYAPEVVSALLKAWESGGAATSKGLTVSDLTAEYEALTMSRTQYVNGLKELGYSQAAADGKVSVSDAKRQRLARNQLINRARVRYTGWKITRQAASDALRAASLTIGNANDLLTYWDAERDLNVHTLTEPQVVKAWKKGIMDRPTATERLSELGLATADIDTRLDES